MGSDVTGVGVRQCHAHSLSRPGWRVSRPSVTLRSHASRHHRVTWSGPRVYLEDLGGFQGCVLLSLVFRSTWKISVGFRAVSYCPQVLRSMWKISVGFRAVSYCLQPSGLLGRILWCFTAVSYCLLVHRSTWKIWVGFRDVSYYVCLIALRWRSFWVSGLCLTVFSSQFYVEDMDGSQRWTVQYLTVFRPQSSLELRGRSW